MPRRVTAENVPEEVFEAEDRWRSFDRRLTAAPPKAGRLGMVQCRVPPGASAAPFHTHQREDEAFNVLSGRGLFRAGETVVEIGPGDCLDCPAGTGIGHQIANPFDQDLVYLAIGVSDPDEVCTYPDSGQVMVRSLGLTGRLDERDYYADQPDPMRILSLWRAG